MSTQPQILANRLNAQKSTGPRTPRGKAVVAQNALKHGLAAHRDVIITESREEFDLHREALLAELDPQTPMESMLADRIVSLSWRLKRADLIQNQTFDAFHEEITNNPLANLGKSFALKSLGLPQPDPADSNPDLILGRIALKDFSNARVLDRLLMYERRIEHSLFKTTLELQRLRLLRNLNPTPNSNVRAAPSGRPDPLFAQNKPNPQNQKITTTSYAAKTSANTPLQSDPEKQTQTNPIQPLSPQRTPNKNHTRLARNVKIVAGATNWPPPTIPNPAKLPNKRPAKSRNY